MYEEKFTEWANWLVRKSLSGLEYPGIYVCAHADDDYKPSW
jgi:hypothetical protein